jgi:hypothetical protein
VKNFYNFKVRKQTGQVEKPHLIKSIRRDRARILTCSFRVEKGNCKPINFMTAESTRNNRKELIGSVRAKTGDKSIKVVYEYKTPPPSL